MHGLRQVTQGPTTRDVLGHRAATLMPVSWEKEWRRYRRVVLFSHGDSDNRNRLRCSADWWDETQVGFDVSWGNGNSDPVWLVGFSVRMPLWLADRIGRIQAWVIVKRWQRMRGKRRRR